MRRISYRSYVLLGISLFLLMSLPMRFTERMRTSMVRLLSPAWHGFHAPSKELIAEIDQLKLENHTLRAQVESIREWLLFEDRLEEQLERFKTLAMRTEGDLFWKEFFRRRCEHLSQFLDKQFQSLPAKVVFREPSSWSSCLWISVGEQDNEALGRTIVAKNSPVLVGTALVGLVEHVDVSRARVRLITDSRLVPAVRAVRGDRYLAKGELRGSNQPLWRSRGQMLKGVGFNYDYSDEEGPARDLRSSGAEAILKVGDLLVTSGLDGIFPPDFPIATVTKVGQLREGASAYELEAKALCSDLDELTYVFVLPPLTLSW